MKTNVVERAYELARSGAFSVRSKISRAMEHEGYSQAELAGLTGASITKDLNRLCKEAAATRT